MKKCNHHSCVNQQYFLFGFCKYCLIWMIAHDATNINQEHIHCKKNKGGCYCLCKKERLKKKVRGRP